MTRVGWIVMGVLLVLLAVGGAIGGQKKKEGFTKPHLEVSRAALIPTEVERRVIVPPCGTGVPVASEEPAALAKTPGTISFILHQGRGDRIVVVPRCQASHGAQVSEGANLPSAAFVLPVGADVNAGRAGSEAAGTELVQSQVIVPARSPIETVVIPRCIETKEAALKTATGRALILDPQPGQRSMALAPPC